MIDKGPLPSSKLPLPTWRIEEVIENLKSLMSVYFRDTTYNKIPRTYALAGNEDFIEYIPPTADIRYHGMCAIGCDDSTHCES